MVTEMAVTIMSKQQSRVVADSTAPVQMHTTGVQLTQMHLKPHIKTKWFNSSFNVAC